MRFWGQVWHASVSNHVRVFAYRLAHAALPCRAMSAGMRGLPRSQAVCGGCDAGFRGGRGRPLESYTHLFLECPSFAAAMDWLLDVWQHIKGSRPPKDARVIIAADPAAAWPPASMPPADVQLWTALRLMLLYHVWAARGSQDVQQRSAAVAVRAAIAAIRREVELQFNRLRLEGGRGADLPPRLRRITAPLQAPCSFDDVWKRSGLVRVDPPVAAGGQPRLVVLLSDSWPVPAPAPPAGPP